MNFNCFYWISFLRLWHLTSNNCKLHSIFCLKEICYTVAVSNQFSVLCEHLILLWDISSARSLVKNIFTFRPVLAHVYIYFQASIMTHVYSLLRQPVSKRYRNILVCGWNHWNMNINYCIYYFFYIWLTCGFNWIYDWHTISL